MARTRSEEPQGIPGPISGEADEAGVHIVTVQSDARLAWPAFVQYQVGRDALLLYTSNLVANPFVHSQFASDADWQAFVSLVQAHVIEASKVPAAVGVRKWWAWGFVWLLVLVAVAALLVNLFAPPA
jgi:hypothetical protein